MSAGRVELFRSKSPMRRDRWYWRLVAANGDELVRSSEGYANRQHAAAMAHLVLTGGYRTAVEPEDDQ